ncbi:MAG: hypothetical protein CL946_07115 [Ectothiorhodospiraceae bacterium]|nr:hypothetical protein [Ectothiorhodospiraceae bacterium]
MSEAAAGEIQDTETLFQKGLEQFNAGEYFDCHDTWEELWRDIRGESRLFYQGLIQVAIGYYHAGNRNFKGAHSQLSKAIEKLSEYPDVYRQVPLRNLLTTISLHRSIYRDALLGKYKKQSASQLTPPIIILQ